MGCISTFQMLTLDLIFFSLSSLSLSLSLVQNINKTTALESQINCFRFPGNITRCIVSRGCILCIFRKSVRFLYTTVSGCCCFPLIWGSLFEKFDSLRKFDPKLKILINLFLIIVILWLWISTFPWKKQTPFCFSRAITRQIIAINYKFNS